MNVQNITTRFRVDPGRWLPAACLLLLLASCSDPETSDATLPDDGVMLDTLAETYVKLGLQLGQYDADYVDAYLGPDTWADMARAEPLSKQVLASEISSLYATLQTIAPADPDLTIRHQALLKNVRAMDTRARMVNGERFAFAEEARLIYDVMLPEYDFAEFDAALAEIERLFPGEGDLADRVDAFRQQLEIPDVVREAVVNRALEACRIRTLDHIALPPGEHFTLEYVTDVNWSGYNWYQGGNESLMQINLDFPLRINSALSLGCHEGYPGHHVWNNLTEEILLKEKGWIEYSLFPLFSPYGLIAEGSANYGVKLAFPEDDKLAFERDVLFPLAGIDPALADTNAELGRLTETLSHARTATAQLYLDGDISREEAVEQSRQYGLTSAGRAEQSVAFIEQYRAYVLNYNIGAQIVEDYVAAQGSTPEEHWQAFEAMLTQLLTASDLSQHD